MMPALMSRWKTIAACAVLGIVVMVAYMTVKPAQYRANAVLILPFEDSSGGGLSSLLEKAAPLSILRGILTSHAAIDKISKETGIPYGKVKDNLKITTSTSENQLSLSVKVTNKESGIKVLDASIKTLQQLSRASTISVSARQAELLESSIREREEKLEATEQELVQFSKNARTAPDPSSPLSSAEYVRRYKENTLALERTKKELDVKRAEAQRRLGTGQTIPTGIPEIEEWRKKVGELEFQLRSALGQFGDGNPQVARLRLDLRAAREGLQTAVQAYLVSANQGLSPELATLESAYAVLKWENQTLKEISDAAPKEAANFSRLNREVISLTESLKALREQHDQAVTKAEVEKVRWSVLVPPYAEDKPANKSLTSHIATGIGLGGFLGILLAAFQVKRQEKRRRRLEKLEEI